MLTLKIRRICHLFHLCLKVELERRLPSAEDEISERLARLAKCFKTQVKIIFSLCQIEPLFSLYQLFCGEALRFIF